MNVLDLFSGIGGFSLGLERAGMRTVAFCECDPYCQRVLRKHWPDVPVFDDVRGLTAEALANAEYARCERCGVVEIASRGAANAAPSASQIDVICGGFPCQDISVAGKGAGIEGSRSGLWLEFARIIGEVRPRYVIVENVAALLGRGLERVLGDLAALGYDAQWHCIPASAIGAPHRRDRIWIVAHPGCERGSRRGEIGNLVGPSRAAEVDGQQRKRVRHAADDGSANVAYTASAGLEGWKQPKASSWGSLAQLTSGQWLVEPDVGRVAHGVPARVDRLRALGNAIVPQIAEIIGRAILKMEE